MKIKTLKLLFIVLVIGVATLILTGCKKTYDIVFWHTMGKGNQLKVETYINEVFTKKTGLSVKLVQVGGYEQLKSNISTAIPAGNQPDIAFCYSDHVAAYNDRGTEDEKPVVDLTKYINDPKIGLTKEEKEDFIDSFWKEGSSYSDEGVFNLPFAKSTEMLFYNKDIIDGVTYKVPETWDELWDLADRFKADFSADFEKTKDSTGAEVPAKKDAVLGYDSAANLLITFAEQKGYKYTDIVAGTKDEEKYLLFAEEPAINEWVETFKLLREKFNNRLLVTKNTNGGSYTSDAFRKGKILMSVGSTGGVGYNVNFNSDETAFNVGITVLPQHDIIRQKIIQQGPNLCIFKTGEKRQKNAWQLMKFLVQPEVTLAFALETGYASPRKSAYESEIFKKFVEENKTSTDPLKRSIALVQELLKGELNKFYTSAAFSYSSSARSEIETLFNTVVTAKKDQIITGDIKTLEEWLKMQIKITKRRIIK